MPDALTLGQTVEQLHFALRDYIESAYHVSHPVLVDQRRRLLDEPAVIYQQPYLESTPRYKTGRTLAELGLDQGSLGMFAEISQAKGGKERLIYDPPYDHQSAAVEEALVRNGSFVVMTGTGSGKTECFLLPILGKLAREASSTKEKFGKQPAVRAIILYPMNALVNDQLGRLRLLFGDPRVANKFIEWSGRPARFARYTSRTLYPGVRDVKKDQQRLAPIEEFYIHYLTLAQGAPSPETDAARALVAELQKRGKWPAKADLAKWFGEKGTRWQDAKTGEFNRCVTLNDEPELLTRHEVLAAPPDILATNYSMLEYMLMRPLERPIFDKTREWLHANPKESLLLVIDEAHLYRGAAGAEVALLLRRLRTRLGIPANRLQVICTSASFKDAGRAAEFGAQLTGKETKDFTTILGTLKLSSPAATGDQKDVAVLLEIDMNKFYEAATEPERLAIVGPFLEWRGIKKPATLHRGLFDALSGYPALGELTNLTMQAACPVDRLGSIIFPNIDVAKANRAVTTLMALAGLARREEKEASLLPCRVHSFYRGLPGLWICMDPACTELAAAEKGKGPAGKLYSQPRDTCACGARILELFTCRGCGSAYARAYADDLVEPNFLWAEAGGAFRTLAGDVKELEPLDLLLEEPVAVECELAEYDLLTGRLNPQAAGERMRKVYLKKDRQLPHDDDDKSVKRPLGEFRPCGVCGQQASFARTSVQDHQTKGDQPFQALISKQIQVQPPGQAPATRLAPLRGRKVLIFSDSRQTAARLAPNLQKYSTQDALRPLIVSGFGKLLSFPMIQPALSLEDLYLGVLIAAKTLGVRLRPKMRTGESFHEDAIVEEAIKNGVLNREADFLLLMMQVRSAAPPEALLRQITDSITDRYYGLESLALASIKERLEHSAKIKGLPELPGVAKTDEEKLAFARTWIRCWQKNGFWLSRMPTAWWLQEVTPHAGTFKPITDMLQNKATQTVFTKEWLPKLRSWFTEPIADKKFKLKGSELSLEIGGAWAYCRACRTTQRPYPGRDICINCGQATAKPIDPDKDSVFAARKGYYRASTVDAFKSPPVSPMALIAAEHTAQLNAAQAGAVFSLAEEHELLFQDINLGGEERPAIDVLSCTTTMEVGIDIGTLSGVSLRNMPPARSNYQQRAGRAGRRGNAVATVTAFGSADSHDEHYFSHPEQMIRGAVEDPTLTLDNRDIARRHITAYLLQRYHQAKLPAIKPEDQPHLFAVLGTVASFKKTSSILNRNDFAEWLRREAAALQVDVSSWLPHEISAADKKDLLSGLVDVTLATLDSAIEYGPAGAEIPEESPAEPEAGLEASPETPPQEGDERPSKGLPAENLLDRLLYKGVLPRYAFPTDVASFYVFDADRSTRFRPEFRFAPSQGLSAALSQYAPGKEVWIDGKLWTSGAIYSPISKERFTAWQNRRLYYECEVCHYARTLEPAKGEKGERLDCDACGGSGTFGKARYWLRPPGFAHPVAQPEGTSPDDQPVRSYATRAKLTAQTPAEADKWTELNERIRVHSMRQHLLVTNRGPRHEGYSYCTKCGVIEPSALPVGTTAAPHKKPYPDNREPNCPGGGSTGGIVLGTDFISDVLLVSLKVKAPITLLPGLLATDVALRTLSEAFTKAGCSELELEAGELHAEYRPALTPLGRRGEEAEIYIYDTLPGGAGFSGQMGRRGMPVFLKALQILESCPDNCESSCYRCLRSYKNKFEHDLLDRHLGASLLRFLLRGEPPVLDAARLGRSTNLLFQDLQRQGLASITFTRNTNVTLPGLGTVCVPILATRTDGSQFAVGLHGPLTPDEAGNPDLLRIRDFATTMPLLLRDELMVRKNLPRVTSDLLKRLT